MKADYLSGITKSLLDLFLPINCLGCQKGGEWLCPTCRAKLIIRPQEICPVCKRTSDGHSCRRDGLDKFWALADYKSPLIDALITQIKYGFTVELVGSVFKEYLEIFWHKFGQEIGTKIVLVPVPLHRRRRLERGFNQSLIIAKTLSEISECEINDRLINRIKYTEHQVGLSGSARQENVRGMFKIDYRQQSACWNKKILLIDDVYTTGSTMGECARTLKEAGFSDVSGLALAVD